MFMSFERTMDLRGRVERQLPDVLRRDTCDAAGQARGGWSAPDFTGAPALAESAVMVCRMMADVMPLIADSGFPALY